MSSKDISREDERWEDITELCRNVSSNLEVGEMVHEDDFSLFEAMSALELMKPKMDKEVPISESIDSRLKSGALPTTGDGIGSADTLASILDGLISCEVAWYEGGSLPETLFTCLYLHSPAYYKLLEAVGIEQPPNYIGSRLYPPTIDTDIGETGSELVIPAGNEKALVLVACALGTLRCCGIARDIVLLADIHEEEDFYPKTFGFRLHPAVSDNLLIALLERAAAVTELESNSSPAMMRVREHVLFRLSFLRSCIALSVAFAKSSAVEQTEASPAVLLPIPPTKFATPRDAILDVLPELSRATAAVAALEKFVSRTPEMGEIDAATMSPGFDRDVNRHLLGSAPSRYVPFTTLGESLTIMHKLTAALETACEIVKCTGLVDARRHLTLFSTPPMDIALEQRGSYPGPSIFARSVATICLYRGELMLGYHGVLEFITDAMANAGVPLSVAQSPVGQTFVDRAVVPLYESLRALCLNRTRLRAKLEFLFGEMADLQERAAVADEDFRLVHDLPDTTPAYLTFWTLREVCLLMLLYVRSGAQLELYSAHELCSAHWYWESVSTAFLQADAALMECKEALRRVMAEDEKHEKPTSTSTSTTSTTSKNKKKNRKQSLSAGGTQSGETLSPTTQSQKMLRGAREHEFAEALQMQADSDYLRSMTMLARGTVRIIRAIQRMHMYGVTAKGTCGGAVTNILPASAACTVFSHRFDAFTVLRSPMYLSWESFMMAATYPGIDASQLLNSAGDCFRTAAALLAGIRKVCTGGENLPSIQAPARDDNLRALAKVAVVNGIAVSSLLSICTNTHTSDTNTRSISQANGEDCTSCVNIDLDIHPEFPAFRVSAIEGKNSKVLR